MVLSTAFFEAFSALSMVGVASMVFFSQSVIQVIKRLAHRGHIQKPTKFPGVLWAERLQVNPLVCAGVIQGEASIRPCDQLKGLVLSNPPRKALSRQRSQGASNKPLLALQHGERGARLTVHNPHPTVAVILED